MIVHAYGIVSQPIFEPRQVEQAEYLARVLFIAGGLVVTALLFGTFFIYPLIRTQIREEGSFER